MTISALAFPVGAWARQPVLGVGAFLKNTLCLIHDGTAVVSEGVGDLDTPEAIRHFEATASQLCSEAGVRPQLIAHDLHPDFFSTRFAGASGVSTLAVQHHHAHIAAIMAEHCVDGPVIGLALDGFGLGPGNQSWGGELLRVDVDGYRRLGHLALLKQPGGDVAAREPWRMAAAVLHRLGRQDEIASRFQAMPAAANLGMMLARGINCPPTSSAGRLFDAACGLAGLRPVAEFEGQAPMELERLASDPIVDPEGWTIDESNVLDLLPVLSRLPAFDPVLAARLFHGTFAHALAQWAGDTARVQGISVIALGGGCFLNRVLTGQLSRILTAQGLSVLTAQKVTPGDQGLSLGQAWIAARAVEERTSCV